MTNGTPLWLQDTAWSDALREYLERWSGRTLTSTCGTDDASLQRYRDSMITTGLDVHATSFDHADELSVEQIVGGVYSALPLDQLPAPDQRPRFRALEPHLPLTEHIRVAILIGRVRPRQ